ncbi:hypothetical protein A0H81_04408 [Grifola frondosa]|uniref:Uncharacterized protein n=1 Tax=Grifola frondosa TaxID=5627 RepID=A0A1C7ME94_GRIFR|nr:hypothetical protein A0H81_04408 [Grifola frondosa]
MAWLAYLGIQYDYADGRSSWAFGLSINIPAEAIRPSASGTASGEARRLLAGGWPLGGSLVPVSTVIKMKVR